MNRAQHLYEILQDGLEHCGFDLRPMLGTMPMRAANELNIQLRPTGERVRRVRMHRHGEANWAVYRLERPQQQAALPMMKAVPADPRER